MKKGSKHGAATKARMKAAQAARTSERMRAAAKRRIHQPTIPGSAVLIATSPDGEWDLYRFGDAYQHADFLRIKLVAKAPRRVKANFWLGLRRTDGALTRVCDAGIMAQHFPSLYAWLSALGPGLCSVSAV